MNIFGTEILPFRTLLMQYWRWKQVNRLKVRWCRNAKYRRLLTSGGFNGSSRFENHYSTIKWLVKTLKVLEPA